MYSSLVLFICALELLSVAGVIPNPFLEIGQRIRANEREKGNLVGKAAPDFTLKDLHGQDVSLSDYRGMVVVLSLWGYACAPCRVEAPYLSKWQEQYEDDGFVVLAVNGYDEPKEVVRKFAKEKNLKQKLLLMGGSVAREKYSVRAYPTVYFIDRSGVIAVQHEGFDESWVPSQEAVIQELLDDQNEFEDADE